MSRSPETAQTVHVPACHHVNPAESLNKCTTCGGSTLLDPPCQPARDVPLLVAEKSQPSIAEQEIWDEFWDTDAARCCSCPSCNFYAPDYEQHKDEPCILTSFIERIIAERLRKYADLAASREHMMTAARFNTTADGRERNVWGLVKFELRQEADLLSSPPGATS